MNCPNCKNVSLSMTERNGIEIDFCPQCRGVWLDRGELDKIIEKSASPAPTQQIDKYPNQTKDYYKYKRKKSFLEELFD